MNAPLESQDILDTPAPRSAVISECEQYRYRLTRFLGTGRRIACVVMLNPSTADATEDDRTIRRCIGFARDWGCGQLFVANLFGFRSTDPYYITVAPDPVGPRNNDYLISAACRAHESGGPVVAAWGVHGGYRDQDRVVFSLLTQTLGIPVKCLGTTAAGFPCHPLYLAKDTPLQPFNGRPLKGV